MAKSLLWTGVALVAIGAIAYVGYVVPRALTSAVSETSQNGQAAGGMSLGMVMLAALGLAIGSALIGIGVGRWKHPRPSKTDGTPEV
jgi:ABC-type tungstate transport system substrate-binding protein